jgi:hypothetical protein
MNIVLRCIVGILPSLLTHHDDGSVLTAA